MKNFIDFIDLRNLYFAWRGFKKGKGARRDVILFERHLEDNLSQLAEELAIEKYMHGSYQKFYVRDPKYRVIHKAMVRDRVVHQALFNELYPLFDGSFFFDSYSSRDGKGTLRAIRRAEKFVHQVGQNFQKPVWVFHGDVDDFFAEINHEILSTRLAKKIKDRQYLSLCRNIIDSFSVSLEKKGIPLGNLTSQLFANVYLHELDYFVKHKMGVRFYLRYNDDFFIFTTSREELQIQAKTIQDFLLRKNNLSMPDEKIIIRNLHSGVDILGTVLYPWGKIPRRRLKIKAEKAVEGLKARGYNLLNWRRAASYLGLLKHSHSFLLREELKNNIYPC